MSVGTTLPFDWGRALRGAAKVANPGTSGTFKLNGRGKGVVTLSDTGTYTLPAAPAGTELLILCDDTSTITIADPSGTIGSFVGTSGTSAMRVTATDGNSWGPELLGAGVGEAAAIGIADAGAYTATANVEAALQEIYAKNTTNAVTTITTVGAGTLTAGAIVGGTIIRSGSTAVYTDTTATLAQILTAIGTGWDGAGQTAALTWLLFIKNTVAFAETLAAGSGVTLAGQTVVPPNSTGVFTVTLSAALDEVTITGIGNMPQANVKNSQFTTIATDTTITAAAGTLTGARMVYYATTAAGAGGIALTTRTAAEMFADIPNCHIGYNWTLRIVSDGGGTVTLTAPGGGGVTITGTATVATNVWKDFCCTFTTATAVTLQNVGSGTVDAT